jgi:hypothetical protein
MRISFALLFVLAFSSLVTAQHKNYKLGEDELTPAVDVNLKDPKNIVIASGHDRIHYTLDGGKDWHEGKNKFAANSAGGTILKSSIHGILFLVHFEEGEINGKQVKKLLSQDSKTGGKTWSQGVSISSSLKDKSRPQLVIHPKKTKLAVTWTEAESFGSSDPACHSQILYSESVGGEKWSIPVYISQVAGDCSGKDNTLHDPSLTMDDEHKVFATWESAGSIVMDRSYDAGKTWLNGDMVGFKMDGPRFYSIPGLDHAERIPLLMADNSRSVYQNSLYMTWADQRNGVNDTDIWFATSIRRGDSWTAPIKVNKDPKGKHQFMPAMTVDPITGVIYIVYYDRRNYTDNQTDVYLAWSIDGGLKFSEEKISDTPFVPVETTPFSSYIGISAANGVVAPVWVRMDDGKTSLWTTIVAQDDLIQAVDMPKLKSVAKTPHGSSNPYSAPLQQKIKRKTGS